MERSNSQRTVGWRNSGLSPRDGLGKPDPNLPRGTYYRHEVAFSKSSRIWLCRFQPVTGRRRTTFAMLFGELDGIRFHSWRLWRSAHVWESYRTALFNGGLLGESIWKSTNQSLAPSHITQNPVTRNRLYGWMRTLGSTCIAHTTHFVAPMPCTAGSSMLSH